MQVVRKLRQVPYATAAKFLHDGPVACVIHAHPANYAVACGEFGALSLYQ
jgi:hypothetical protein